MECWKYSTIRNYWSSTTAWKVPKYGVISAPNKGKCRPGITPYLETFHAVYYPFIVNNNYQQDSRVLYKFILNRSFGQALHF